MDQHPYEDGSGILTTKKESNVTLSQKALQMASPTVLQAHQTGPEGPPDPRSHYQHCFLLVPTGKARQTRWEGRA